MKKVILIAAIMLLAATNHKSEAQERRSEHTRKSYTSSQKAVQRPVRQERRTASTYSDMQTRQKTRERNPVIYNKPGKKITHNNQVRKKIPAKNPVVYGNTVRKTGATKRNYEYHRRPEVNVVWTHNMYREYRLMYPDFHYRYYPAGSRIVTIPSYRAYYDIGEVRNVYGRVYEVWYSWQTDEYYLYFGGNYPYNDFTVILSGKHARRFSRHPEAFFAGRHIWATGLLSSFKGKPELLVMKKQQIHLY